MRSLKYTAVAGMPSLASGTAGIHRIGWRERNAVRTLRRAALAAWVGSATLAATPGAMAQIKPLSVLAQRGGPLQTGTYACKQQYNRAGYTYKVVQIDSPTRYAWVAGGKKPGAMTYDASSGRIAFTSGPLGKGFEAYAGRRADGAAVIILVDTDLAPKADAYDNCVPKK